MRKILRLIIPVYNEEDFLKNNPKALGHFKELSKQEGVEIFFCLGGGEDHSEEMISLEVAGHENIKVIKEETSRPSVHKSISLGLSGAGEYVLICPLDVMIPEKALGKLLQFLETEKADYGFFMKSYDPCPGILKFQGLYLNYWRLGLLREFVWTNAPFFKTSLIKGVELPDFLDDLYLSHDLLKRSYKAILIKEKVIVSPRRYLRKGIYKQILTNLIVLIGHGLGVKENALKHLYRKI